MQRARHSTTQVKGVNPTQYLTTFRSGLQPLRVLITELSVLGDSLTCPDAVMPSVANATTVDCSKETDVVRRNMALHHGTDIRR